MYVVIDCYEGEAEIVGRAETVEQAKQIEDRDSQIQGKAPQRR